MHSDADAVYAGVFAVDCSVLTPMLAAPGDPGNGLALADLKAPVKIDIAYGGSCTAGKREDFDHYHAVLAWALAHRERFPVNLNTAPRELLLRVPGFGVQTVDRLLAARRVRRLRHADLARLHVPLKKVLPFVEAADYRPGRALEAADLAAQLAPPPVQRSLF